MILVVGGAGYIGSHTAKRLIEKGYGVVVLDDLSKGHRKAVPQGAVFVEGSFNDGRLLSEIFRRYKIDAVMHFAARIEVGESMRKPVEFFHHNVCKTLNLLEAMLDYGIKFFIFSSSAAVYGNPRVVPIPEDHPINPTSVYGETKAMVERVLFWLDRTRGLKYVSLRYFNAAGADPSGEMGEDHRPETHLIPRVLEVALGKRPHIEVYGNDYPTKDGTPVRDYIHVVDLADAHILALDWLKGGNPSEVFNLGNGAGYTVLEVIETARKVTGHPILTKIGPRRPGDPAVLVASNEKAKEKLGWKPTYGDLETIVATAWRWHKNHPNGYGEG